VNTDNWTVIAANQLDKTSSSQDLTLAVASEVVFVNRNIVGAIGFASLGF
jgi:hypothetical protein